MMLRQRACKALAGDLFTTVGIPLKDFINFKFSFTTCKFLNKIQSVVKCDRYIVKFSTMHETHLNMFICSLAFFKKRSLGEPKKT